MLREHLLVTWFKSKFLEERHKTILCDAILFLMFFKLKDSQFTVLCQFQGYDKAVRLYKYISPIAQLVKNLPAMPETPDGFLDWEDLPEKGEATHSNILGLPLWLS